MVGHAQKISQPRLLVPGSAAVAAALKSGQGPPGRVLAEGVSLLSVGERGPRPLPPTNPAAKNYRVLRCFVLSSFLALFRLLWFKMGQHGPR